MIRNATRRNMLNIVRIRVKYYKKKNMYETNLPLWKVRQIMRWSCAILYKIFIVTPIWLFGPLEGGGGGVHSYAYLTYKLFIMWTNCITALYSNYITAPYSNHITASYSNHITAPHTYVTFIIYLFIWESQCKLNIVYTQPVYNIYNLKKN